MAVTRAKRAASVPELERPSEDDDASGMEDGCALRAEDQPDVLAVRNLDIDDDLADAGTGALGGQRQIASPAVDDERVRVRPERVAARVTGLHGGVGAIEWTGFLDAGDWRPRRRSNHDRLARAPAGGALPVGLRGVAAAFGHRHQRGCDEPSRERPLRLHVRQRVDDGLTVARAPRERGVARGVAERCHRSGRELVERCLEGRDLPRIAVAPPRGAHDVEVRRDGRVRIARCVGPEGLRESPRQLRARPRGALAPGPPHPRSARAATAIHRRVFIVHPLRSRDGRPCASARRRAAPRRASAGTRRRE